MMKLVETLSMPSSEKLHLNMSYEKINLCQTTAFLLKVCVNRAIESGNGPKCVAFIIFLYLSPKHFPALVIKVLSRCFTFLYSSKQSKDYSSLPLHQITETNDIKYSH